MSGSSRSDPREPADASTDEGIDLRQFHALFFEEAAENLERMEQLLLALDLEAPENEALNAIFRCVHSVKGGAATLGFADVADLAHQMESLLDRLRRGALGASRAMLDTLLHSGDALGGLLARHRGNAGALPEVAPLLATLRSLAQPGAAIARAEAAPAEPIGTSITAPDAAPATLAERRLALQLGPLHDPAALADLVALFDEIADLGRIEPRTDADHADGMHHFWIRTACSDAELTDLFAFHVDSALVRLTSTDRADLPEPAAATATPPEALASATPATAHPTPAELSSLRVPLAKVDQLINLVGELVITQAMLVQRCAALAPAAQRPLAASLGELERHMRQLQESVLSIRMMPVAVVFGRFPRLLRELGLQLGKKARLVTLGEATELDKGLIEKITDPLTHLVRNSLDHGIESPAERVARGKPETGTITLAASHQGGSIVIEVRDDGRGLSRSRLLGKARERGLAAPDTLCDEEVWSLIFAPGFSTAEQVTEVSGRGVGLDVVRRNISDMGGVVEIESHEGQGMLLRVRLPLTLAIMDSMSVRVADEVYVLPLSAVLESMPAAPALLHALGGGAQVLRLRDEQLPVLDLAQLFAVPCDAPAGANASILVVVEADGARIALRVDELLGQQQVVVKNLESHFKRVDNVSGATLMGDGRVALILDVRALVNRTRH